MKTYRVVLWALALCGLAADQASKYGVFAWLGTDGRQVHWLFQADGRHGFALAPNSQLNNGALFGLGQTEWFANGAFAVVSLAAAAAIVYWSFRPSAARDLWVCLALGLILAGTLGNLYDRVVFGGVRDFLHWNYLFDWPVFNVADSCLVCGAGLLLLQAFGRRAPASTPAPHVPFDVQAQGEPQAFGRRAPAPAAKDAVVSHIGGVTPPVKG